MKICSYKKYKSSEKKKGKENKKEDKVQDFINCWGDFYKNIFFSVQFLLMKTVLHMTGNRFLDDSSSYFNSDFNSDWLFDAWPFIYT